MDYDITVTGGLVVDGTGTPARRADVAITAGRIAAIGEGPFTAIRPAVIATSARRAGVPVPSTTSPPVTVMS
ncbi:hypothetical protein GS901_27055 [Rhodococcus hoagii]|nr:hypothetical protein [Prescottella equi]